MMNKILYPGEVREIFNTLFLFDKSKNFQIYLLILKNFINIKKISFLIILQKISNEKYKITVIPPLFVLRKKQKKNKYY